MENYKITISPPSPPIKLVASPSPIVREGSGSGSTYQKAASTQWVVVHNRGHRPSVTCTDTTGEEIMAQIVHVSLNEVHINHQFNQAGTVYIQ